jgi:hypothetical protein
MRDGIYKSLKLGQGWKSLLKSCEREKERGDMASGKARNAIARDLYIEVSAVFVHEILARVRQSDLLPGFRTIDPELTCRDLGGNKEARNERRPWQSHCGPSAWRKPRTPQAAKGTSN